MGMLACTDTFPSGGTTGRATVTPLGGTRMRIPVSSTQAALQRSAAGTSPPDENVDRHAYTSVYISIGRDNKVEP